MLKSQSGRSMVEMLGVLAVVGVLSVAGVAGYTMAMNKYRANEVAQASTLAVVELMTSASLANQKGADVHEVTAQISNIADLTLPSYNGKDKAYVKLEFHNKDVCKQFKNTFTSTSEYEVIGKCED